MMGCAMRGSDGEVGAVSDLLFDDTTWRLRWIVVNTRYWFPSHEVLLPAAAMGRSNPSQHWLAIDLTMRQIEHGLAAGRDLPVSRQAAASPSNNPHLRSVEAVVGHHVHLFDGLVGHIEELLVDDADWIIRYVRVDTWRWRPGDKVLLATRFVREIDWRGKSVRFDIGRQEIVDDKAHRDVVWLRTEGDGRPRSNGREESSTQDQGRADSWGSRGE
jgi:hypothetical protein